MAIAIIIYLFLYYFMEKAMATHSSTRAWKIPWVEEPGRLQSMWSPRGGHDWATSLSLCSGEGNGNPLQCSCLENPRDGGARWAAIYGVTQSRTRLTWLSSSSSSSIADKKLCDSFKWTIKGLRYICMYPFSPRHPSYPGCHVTLSRVPRAIPSGPLLSVCPCGKFPMQKW